MASQTQLSHFYALIIGPIKPNKNDTIYSFHPTTGEDTMTTSLTPHWTLCVLPEDGCSTIKSLLRINGIPSLI